MDELSRPLAVPFFFFGTLMDIDVLARVVGRRVRPSEFEPALLWGQRRHQVRNAPYPVLRPHRDSHVRGVLFQPRSWDERLRVDHFESGEYEADILRVQAGTRMVDALCYLDLADVFEVEPQDWSLHHFRAVVKPDYLAQCDAWMADYVALT